MTAHFSSSRLQLTAWLTALALVAVTAIGCGPAADKLFPVAKVNGKLTYQGKAPEGAQIFLKAVSAPPDANYTPIGTVKGDGSFQISTYGKSDGAPPGEYIALVQWFKPIEGGIGPNVLPKKYSNPTTSPIKLTVKEGSNDIPPIVIDDK